MATFAALVEEKERKSETVTATDPTEEEKKEGGRDIIKLLSQTFFPLPIMEAKK